MTLSRFLMLLSLPLLFSGCDDGGDGGGGDPPEGNARYRVTFDAIWSAATHPNHYPPGAHFSGLVGGAHSEDLRLWQQGGQASEGIRRMAEVGSKVTLLAEVNAFIAEGRACSTLSGGAPGTPGSASATFSVTPDCTAATVVTMIAPSPDWFSGVSGVELARGGDWVDSVTVPANAYDAGTDSGADFTSADQVSNPRGSILPISGFPRVGSITFTRIE